MNLLFVSLGCDKNRVDSEHMLSILAKDGFTLVDDEAEAEVIIVNTCCFIHDAMEESIQTFYQASQEDLQKKQTEKMEPIQAKIVAAIKKIGEAGGYVYVVDLSTGAIPFINESLSTDVTAQLKAELGIK